MAETGQAEITRAVPAARWKAKKEGIDLSLVKGSGPHGVILPRDLEQAQVTQGAIEATLKERRFHASTLARKLAEREGVALEVCRGDWHARQGHDGGRGEGGRAVRLWRGCPSEGEGALREDDSHDPDAKGHFEADGPERLYGSPHLLSSPMWRWTG